MMPLQEQVLLSPAVRRTLTLVAGAAIVLTLLGWFLDREHAAAGFLVAGQYAIGIGLGGILFIAFLYAANAGWATAIRRIPEAMAATIPVGGLLVLASVLLALPVYEWMDADRVHQSPLLEHKAGWLSAGGVIARTIIYILVWSAFAWALRRSSLRQDQTGQVSEFHRSVRLSCMFLAAFAITWALASFDWVMSLEAEWFSTVFAVYTLSGFFLSGLAVITIVAILLRRYGPLRGVLRDDHLHDLAKLMFGFSVFWAYIWFCQYMLIWYSDIPEETIYYVRRFEGTWGPLMVLNLAVNWAIPFLVLLPRPSKRSEAILLKVSALLLVGRWLDLHLLVMPGIDVTSPFAILWEFTAIVGFLCVIVLVGAKAFRSASPVPRHDPYLEESLHHHI